MSADVGPETDVADAPAATVVSREQCALVLSCQPGPAFLIARTPGGPTLVDANLCAARLYGYETIGEFLRDAPGGPKIHVDRFPNFDRGTLQAHLRRDGSTLFVECHVKEILLDDPATFGDSTGDSTPGPASLTGPASLWFVQDRTRAVEQARSARLDSRQQYGESSAGGELLWGDSTEPMLTEPMLTEPMLTEPMLTEQRRFLAVLEAGARQNATIARVGNDCLWEWDLATDRITWGASFPKIFGHPCDETTSKLSWWLDQVHPDDRERVRAEGARATQSGNRESIVEVSEYRMRRADGTYADVVDRGFGVADDTGKVVRLLGAITDVSALRRLTDERDLFFSLSPNPLALSDREGRLLRVNPGFLRCLGYSASEVLGRTLMNWFHPDDIPRMMALGGDVLTHGQIPPVTARVRTASGEHRVLECNIAPVDARREQFVVVAHDVTDQKTALDAVNAGRLRVDRILASISDIFFSIDWSWRLSYLNPRAESLFLATSEALFGKDLWETFPSLRGTRLERECRSSAETRRPVSYDVFFPPKNAWYAVRVYPYDEGVSVYLRDITGERKADDALRFSEERRQRQLRELAEAARLIHAEPTEASTLALAAARARAIVGANASVTRLASPAVSASATPPSERLTVTLSEDESFDGEMSGPLRILESVLWDETAPRRSASPWILQPSDGAAPVGFTGFLGAPLLRADNTRLGAIVLADRESGEFSDDDLDILAQIARMASGAIENIRLLQQTRDELSERRRTEAALRESEERFRAMADNAPVIIWMTDIDGNEAFLNLPWFRFVSGPDARRLSRDDPAFVLWRSVVHPDDLPGAIDMAYRLQKDRATYPREYRLLRHDGEYRWFLDTATPRYDGNGQFCGYIGSCLDITERKAFEERQRRANQILEEQVSHRTEQLRVANAALIATNRELESFCHSVSHDLRAPLRGIDGFSQALEEDCGDALDETGRDYLRRVRGEARHMATLIDSLLRLSRVTRLESRHERVDVSKLAHEVMRRLLARTSSQPVEFVVAPGIFVDGDRALLTIALENLLDNALKFTRRRETPRVEIGLEIVPDDALSSERSEWPTDATEGIVSTDTSPTNAGREPRALALFVRDNGAGFDPRYASQLFQPFQRLHSSQDFPGMGIGLATVERVVRKHDGHLWARGVPDGGATFFLWIPGLLSGEGIASK